jgi:formate-dependent nitrite reductase membrane component NrfD
MGRRETLMSQLRGEPPPADDGRNVDSRLGVLEGEGAAQQIDRLARERPHPPPSELHDSTSDLETYYGLPLLKEHVWKAAVPAYFYVGGLAGASAALGAAATWSGSPLLRGLIRKTRLIAAGGAMVSAVLLIEDLGRPSRFFNMLRVFRPTSPMSVGSWLLAGFGALSTTAALFRGRRVGPLAAVGDGAALGAGVLGVPLAGYTAVLLSSTAVPLWQGARTSLPPLFMASAITSASCVLDLCELNALERRAVRRFGIAGKAAELIFSKTVERKVARPAIVGAPLREGLSGALWKGAKLLIAASLALSLAPRASPRLRRASGWLGTFGSLALRFGMLRAGRMSVRDPRAAFAQQRAGATAVEAAQVIPPGHAVAVAVPHGADQLRNR